ncbi:MAG: hypothetical protein PWQ63_875 [Methanolobus sp.]|jgi:hypothetical protein|nr:hypothetical protein [Methanolobus sp.]MDK2947715.1 hypothetical protein [Methanolobus sp.]
MPAAGKKVLMKVLFYSLEFYVLKYFHKNNIKNINAGVLKANHYL